MLILRKFDTAGTHEGLCKEPTRDTFSCYKAPVLANPVLAQKEYKLEYPVVLAHKCMKLLEIHLVWDQKSMKLLEVVAFPVSWAEGTMGI